jgi:hypothetical protein
LSPVLLELDDSFGARVGLGDSGATSPTPIVAVTGFSVLPGETEYVERGRGELVRRGVGDAEAARVRVGAAVAVCVGEGVGEDVTRGVGSTQRGGLAQVGDGEAASTGLDDWEGAAEDLASAVPGGARARKGRAATPAAARRTRNRAGDIGTASW